MRDQSAVAAPPRQELEELANKLQTVSESPDVGMVRAGRRDSTMHVRLKKRIVRTLINGRKDRTVPRAAGHARGSRETPS